MKNCILCGDQTHGSIGAAGHHWSFICQICKDKEDAALMDKIVFTSKIIKRVEEDL